MSELKYEVSSFKDLGPSSITTNIDWIEADIQVLDLDNDPTLTFTNGRAGRRLKLLLKQQIAGQRTITWPADVIWSGDVSPTLQNIVTPGIDYYVVNFEYNGIYYIGF